MINSISSASVNPVKLFNAVNAFKATTKPAESIIPETSAGLDINDNNILKNQDLNEIKNIAQIAGENNLSDDDIQYGLTYGRSVIADYII